MRKIQDADFKDKKVLVRADFNVAIDDKGDVLEKFKIGAVKRSVAYVLEKEGAKVALLSWLGRPGGKYDEKLSLAPLTDDIERELGVKVKFVKNCVGEEVAKNLSELESGEILLLENVRFHEGEKENSDEFSEKLAENFDIFIQDAFSVCHRDVASVTGVTRFLPSYAGFSLQEEIERMDGVLEDPARPATAIIGGAKIETKLPLIKKFEGIYDNVLVGGKVANEALDEKIDFSDKVILPVDFQGDRLDIGEETIARFKEILSNSSTIVWNGPLGKFEEKPYDRSTREILDAVTKSEAFTLVGGGESVQALEENGILGKVSFVSTGGGAMLEYLSGNRMPGLEALK